MDKVNFSLANIIWIIGVIFMAGIAYSEIKYLSAKLDEQEIIFNERIMIIDQRLDKKIKELNDLDSRTISLEIELARVSACR